MNAATTGRRRMPGLLLAGLLAGSLAGGVCHGDARSDTHVVYEALVRRTEGGIPHIKANDFGSLGFGTGYAMAQDNVCLLADRRPGIARVPKMGTPATQASFLRTRQSALFCTARRPATDGRTPSPLPDRRLRVPRTRPPICRASPPRG